jgi:hypothetical protein
MVSTGRRGTLLSSRATCPRASSVDSSAQPHSSEEDLLRRNSPNSRPPALAPGWRPRLA